MTAATDRAAEAARSTRDQHYRITADQVARGLDRPGRLAEISRLAGRAVPGFWNLTRAEADRILTALDAR